VFTLPAIPNQIFNRTNADYSVTDLCSSLTQIVGENNVSSLTSDLISNARDYWPISNCWFLNGVIPGLPDVVVWPESVMHVAAILEYANLNKIPVIPYGEGSGVLGGVVPVKGGIMLDMKKMNKIIKVDEMNLLATVECGLNGSLYEEKLNQAGFTGGHFPQSLRCSTVGGWLACRAAGQLSTRYGKIEDIVKALEAVLPDGTIFKGRSVPRAATGPRMDQLMLGSEGTLGVITSAELQIWPLPEKKHKVSYLFENLNDALDAIRLFMYKDIRPAVVRLYDSHESNEHFPSFCSNQQCMLIIMFEGAAQVVEAESELLNNVVRNCGATNAGSDPVDQWLEKRFNVSKASTYFQQGAVLDTIEVSTNWHNAFSTYQEMQKALMSVRGTKIASGHYSHVYAGGAALYLTTAGFPDGDKTSYYKIIWKAAMEACIKEGASISHHHGIGLHRGQWMAAEQGASLDVLRRIKNTLDPNNIMNPGKLGYEEASLWQV
jgi:alkyldihydroxyacetonephosphate synthase